jgi:hypothetical protein
MRSILSVLAVLLLPATISAQATKAPLCEASPSTRHAFQSLQNDVPQTNTVLRERRQALDKLIAQNPDDVFLHLDYLLSVDVGGDGKTSAIARYKKLLDEHPGNSTYEFLYAVSLIARDTPEAISRLRAVPPSAPIAPLAHAQLGELYEWGKFANREEMRKQTVAFYDACPNSLDWRGTMLLREGATPEMAAKYGPQLRKRLQGETDLTLLSAWNTVWDLEFVAAPAARHDAVRARLREGISQLRDKIHSDELGWLYTLKSGYHLSGDKTAEREIADQIVTKYPDAGDTRRIWRAEGFGEGEEWQKDVLKKLQDIGAN